MSTEMSDQGTGGINAESNEIERDKRCPEGAIT